MRSKLHQTWKDMKKRCYDHRSRDYRYYGEKGIAVSERWMSFENFWNDMGDSYFEGATIDRIDSTGPYSIENCRWLTRRENTSRAHKGKVLSEDQRKAISKFNKGRLHSEESIEKMKEKARDRCLKKVLCEWCNREFDIGNFTKSHGDRCKLHPDNGYVPHRYLTKEERANIQKEVARKRLLITKECEWCNEKIDVANFAKHHGIKCKLNRGV